MQKRSGFTLIELLVVIAIIALLMSILMPSLKVCRELAKGINCMSNQKTMALAYIMYTDDNDGSMCCGFALYAPINGVPPWVMPPLDYKADGSYQEMPLGDVTREQRYNGLREGVLYPYINNTGAYHCPGEPFPLGVYLHIPRSGQTAHFLLWKTCSERRGGSGSP